jgi:pyruvate,water dikinase
MSGVPSQQLVDLDDPVAADLAVSGGKASSLAKAASSGVATLGGVVLTTSFSRAVDGGAAVASSSVVAEAFRRAGGDQHALVARSSSVVEDSTSSSMAGQFASVIGVHGLDAFVEAVCTVLESRERAGASEHPIAVLVQPLIEPAFGGVLFGVDPVTGRTDRRMVSAVLGGPEPLVSGERDGSRYLLDPQGRVLEHDRSDGPAIGGADLRRLVQLADQVAAIFGTPQDVEWAIGEDGQLWLLQSRPVTTEIRGAPSGPIYGPGLVAETFPEALSELERDLWVPPLRDGIRNAVLLAGTAEPTQLDRTQVVVTVDGYVAIDLQLAGEILPERSLVHRLNPLPAVRRLQSAWRVGRLRSALPGLAESLLDRVDADLEDVPPVESLTSRQLVALLHRGRSVLRALHAHEILMGMLTDTGGNRMTGASVALRVLAEGRRDGLSDEDLLARSPVVLALTGPRVAPEITLPADAVTPDTGVGDAAGTDNGVLREALRLRARWVQELTGRAAWQLGERLAANGELPAADAIHHLELDVVEALVTKRAVAVRALIDQHVHHDGTPLPACFQLSDLSMPITARRADEVGGGTGAGGGTGSGPITHDVADPPPGAVLVVTTLTPGLGPLLPRLGGVIAETGSVLSHLAILAREARVPTVVGYAGATEQFSDGVHVHVDGDSGGSRSSRRWQHEGRRLARRHRDADRRAGLHDRLAESVGVEPGAVLRPHRGHRRDRSGNRPDPAPAGHVESHGSDARSRDPRRAPRQPPSQAEPLRVARPDSHERVHHVPVGGGVLISALAWVVDRVASNTTTPAGEERLARQLGAISYPRGGLLVVDITVLAQAVPGCDDAQLRRLLRRAGHGA